MRSDCKSARTDLMFIGICNPDALKIRIFNPKIALQMLLFNAVGLQIRPNAKIRQNGNPPERQNPPERLAIALQISQIHNKIKIILQMHHIILPFRLFFIT